MFFPRDIMELDVEMHDSHMSYTAIQLAQANSGHHGNGR